MERSSSLVGLNKKLGHEILLPNESELIKGFLIILSRNVLAEAENLFVDCDFEMRTPAGAYETSKYNLLLFALIRKLR
jgi:hypothetical protein